MYSPPHDVQFEVTLVLCTFCICWLSGGNVLDYLIQPAHLDVKRCSVVVCSLRSIVIFAIVLLYFFMPLRFGDLRLFLFPSLQNNQFGFLT